METVITGNTRGGAEPTARLFGLEMNERDFNNMMIRFAAIYGFRIAGMMLREQTGCGAALTADAPAALPDTDRMAAVLNRFWAGLRSACAC